MIKEFKPAFLFLARFLGIYLLGNIAYGLLIESYGQVPDAFTVSVSSQTAGILRWFGEPSAAVRNEAGPTVFLQRLDDTVLNIYEGCNGVNVVVVFVAFVIAFGGRLRSMLLFLSGGIIVLHLANLGRIILLYQTALHYQEYFYYVHKYFFTAILYLIVFSMWAVWVIKFNVRSADKNKPVEPAKP
jgi:exosortase family protein XrtF